MSVIVVAPTIITSSENNNNGDGPQLLKIGSPLEFIALTTMVFEINSSCCQIALVTIQ